MIRARSMVGQCKAFTKSVAVIVAGRNSRAIIKPFSQDTISLLQWNLYNTKRIVNECRVNVVFQCLHQYPKNGLSISRYRKYTDDENKDKTAFLARTALFCAGLKVDVLNKLKLFLFRLPYRFSMGFRPHS